jgi:hypothetical protein
MNYGGNQYLVNMLKLSTTSSSGSYEKTDAATKELRTTELLSMKTGNQGSVNYHCITRAPYLTKLNNNGNTTSQTITAILYDSNDNEVQWSAYMNKYYSGTLVTEYPSKTDLSSGKWAFKVTGNFATVSGIYEGTPVITTMAVVGYVNTTLCYVGVTSYIYKRIDISNGVKYTYTTNNVVVANGVKVSGTSLVQDTSTSAARYLQQVSKTAYYMNASGESKTSNYFAQGTSTATTWSDDNINECAAIVGPVLMPVS